MPQKVELGMPWDRKESARRVGGEEFEIRKLEVKNMENEAIQKAAETVERRTVRGKGQHGLGNLREYRKEEIQ